MSKETTTPNPCTDIPSLSIECQIDRLLSSALDVCDNGIHHREYNTKTDYDETLWNIRILVKSARNRFNYGLDKEAFGV